MTGARTSWVDVRGSPSPDVGLVTYAVTARRAGVEYSALVSSLYVQRDGHWRMRFHQQSPR